MYANVIKEIQESSLITPKEAAEKILAIKKQKFPLPIIDISQKMGFSVFSVDHLDGDASGVIGIDANLKEKFGNSKCVLINRNIKPGKRRFVLAHEIGHYLFDFNEREDYIYYNHYAKNKQASDETSESEKKANLFAANLLMPETIFITDYTKLFDQDIPLYEILDKLAEKYGVTAKAVELRIGELIDGK